MTNLIVVKGVKQYLKKHGAMMGNDTAEALDTTIAKVIDQAIINALKQSRKTIYAKHLPSIEVKVEENKPVVEKVQEQPSPCDF